MIELQAVDIQAGSFRLSDVSFIIPTGEYAILMGKTGRGKTTILEAICGLREVQNGFILIDNQDVTQWSPGARHIGYVPQDLALFPTLSVRENLAFGLRLAKYSRSHTAERIEQLADLLGISALLSRRVQGLSGGESQRVALGRALAAWPKILILDEPLSALDMDTRTEMIELLRTVKKTTAVTILHVTHNPGEATQVADLRLELTAAGEIHAFRNTSQ
ncbi:MAG: ATP-binding cassette domain-containing protein [Planctomycetales bacterium]|nr:ATP-binding cassette domain-containing protein [Planctomycetales bacterium]